MDQKSTNEDLTSLEAGAGNDLKIEGIGHSLKCLRDELGLEGQELAAAIKINASTLSKYENGKRAIPFSLFLRLSQVTNQDPLALLVWCMRGRFPELGDSSNDITQFLHDALRRLEQEFTCD